MTRLTDAMHLFLSDVTTVVDTEVEEARKRIDYRCKWCKDTGMISLVMSRVPCTDCPKPKMIPPVLLALPDVSHAQLTEWLFDHTYPLSAHRRAFLTVPSNSHEFGLPHPSRMSVNEYATIYAQATGISMRSILIEASMYNV